MYIGIDVGGSHIGYGLLDEEFNIVKSIIKFTNEKMTSKDIIRLLVEGINEIITQEVIYIGIGFPGKCDLKKQTVTVNKYNNFRDINIVKELQEIFDIPVYFDNDANCATIAEKYKGKLRNIENGIFFTVGTGIGAGIVINDKLYRGSNFYAGEIGHAFLYNNEKNMDCLKKNEYENIISLRALRQSIQLIDEQINDIISIFKSENIEIRKLYSSWINNLANCLIEIWYMIDPQIIILGGGITEIFEYIYDDLIKILKNKIPYISIDKAMFNNNAGIIGASLLGKDLV